MKYNDIVKGIEKIAPPELAEPWDNSGTQVFSGEEEISKILVCLEVTDEVISEAISRGFHMIVSHHPLIFGSIDSVNTNGYGSHAVVSRYIAKLIDNDICLYSAHTSFDNAPEGNNSYMAKLLGLIETEGPSENLMGVIGRLPEEITLEEAKILVTKALGITEDHIRVVGKDSRVIGTVALCTGAGGDFLESAVAYGCDLMITGDVKFNQAHYAKASGIALIDAGHYGTEKIFAENFTAQLRSLCPEITVEESSVNPNPYMV